MDLSGLAYALINTPGIGGVIIMTVFVTACTIYYVLTRWIIAGGEVSDGRRPQQDEG